MNEMVSCSEKKDESVSSLAASGGEKLGSGFAPTASTALLLVAVVAARPTDAPPLGRRDRPPKGEDEGMRPRTGDETGVGAFRLTGLRPSDDATEGKRRRAGPGLETTRRVPTPRAMRVDRARRTTAPTVSLPDESLSAAKWVDGEGVRIESESDDQSPSSSAALPLNGRSPPRRSRRRREAGEKRPSCGRERRGRAGGREMGS